ncbi:LamB/YcsF family protein [Cohnella caldifontis]|uniref:LamB/YcsF family protein n=1 Tax=Cohnella caldifontis TaxID=3027471 RepID=UPI0023EA7FCF|nr:5-oxoprolinase subunit PxpA [Cohnella sp. YIM B05605]
MTETIREIDLNADLGEGFGIYACGEDEALLRVVSSANIACGFHAGDPHLMRRTVESCLENGVAIGAHPGLPDRMGFGRREMRVAPREAADWILYQVGALQAFASAAGGAVRHVKLHGALYHMASADPELAAAAALAVRSAGRELLLYGPPDSKLSEAAEEAGLAYVPEGFADRAYTAGGTLAPRSVPGSVLEDEASMLEQALMLAEGNEFAGLDGKPARIAVRTICIHGDTPRAAAKGSRLAEGLRREGWTIRAPRGSR